MFINKEVKRYNWPGFVVIFVFALSCMFVSVDILNAQRLNTFNILVKINGESDAIENVSVNITSPNFIDDPVEDVTKSNGWVIFSRFEAGSYTITPDKEGRFFIPSSLTINLGEGTKKRTLVTFQSGKGSPPEEDTFIPFQNEWASSAHADVTAEAFTHWDEDGEIPASCAKCHSVSGILDFLGDDGTPSGVVDNAAPIGTVITCEVCHNDTAIELDSVTFPSGKSVSGVGHEAVCMQCHQGRSSKTDVDKAIEDAEVVNDDTVSDDLNFINIHYFAAAATLYGGFAEGGYQYDGKSYDGRLSHAEGVSVCIDCHNPHTLKIKVDLCATCHKGVEELEDLFDVRMNGSLVDYDGDGNIAEGIFFEIETLREKLLDAMRNYADEKIAVPIAYLGETYPYFFIDINKNGTVDPDEASFDNRYNQWTPRILKAAYNYQVSVKDPGAFTHGGKYIIELLFDSIEDVNSALTVKVVMDGMSRADEGHFDGSKESFRHWDEDGEVSGSCAKCHGGGGLPVFLKNGTNIEAEIQNGMLCSNCHDDLTDFSLTRSTESVVFPSGLTADLGDDSNLCMTCHQGRNSKKSVDDEIASSPGPYSFINIHYYPVAATLFGTDVKGGYEFEGKDYAGQNKFGSHLDIYDTCVECHMGTKGIEENKSHNVIRPNPANCVSCHGNDVSQSNPGNDPDLFNFREIRPAGIADYDGDGNVNESIFSEITRLREVLIAESQTYAADSGNPLVYEESTYPYFFNDTNGNNIVDVGEADFANRYVLFDANLLKAAYNYHACVKEPGGYIHNSKYIAQLLVDSIEVLGGDVSVYTWR